jgi:hypothetical protein
VIFLVHCRERPVNTLEQYRELIGYIYGRTIPAVGLNHWNQLRTANERAGWRVITRNQPARNHHLCPLWIGICLNIRIRNVHNSCGACLLHLDRDTHNCTYLCVPPWSDLTTAIFETDAIWELFPTENGMLIPKTTKERLARGCLLSYQTWIILLNTISMHGTLPIQRSIKFKWILRRSWNYSCWSVGLIWINRPVKD